MQWDEEKYRTNLKKHQVPFEYAAKAIQDPYSLLHYDTDHSGYNKYGEWEDRYQSLGESRIGVLFVVFTERDGDERIISAWHAEKDDEKEYYSR